MDLVALTHYRRTGTYEGCQKLGRRRKTRRSTLALFACLGLSLVMYRAFASAIVDGVSMEPTLQSGQRLLYTKLVGDIKDGDIVVVRNWLGNDYLVKRVYKKAGEVVEVPYKPTYLSPDEAAREYRVPQDSVFLLGDNYFSSTDSRAFGPVPIEHIAGKVVLH